MFNATLRHPLYFNIDHCTSAQDCKPQERTFQNVLADLQAGCLVPVDLPKLRTSLKLTVTWLGLHASGLDGVQLTQVRQMWGKIQ